MNMNREDDIVMLQNNADGQAFQRLDRLWPTPAFKNTCWAKLKPLIWKTAAEQLKKPKKNTKGDRIDGYLHLLNFGCTTLG